MTEKDRAALERAKQQHYLVESPRGNTPLFNAYWLWCRQQPWHPCIRMYAGPRYAVLTVNVDPVHNTRGSYVIGLTDAAHEQVWQVFRDLFEATKDRWARNGLVATGGFARGMPVDLVEPLMAALWPVVNHADAYIDGWSSERYVATAPTGGHL